MRIGQLQRWQIPASGELSLGAVQQPGRALGQANDWRMRPDGVVLQADQQPGSLGLPYH
jgi:hypothetical protein